MGFKCWTDLTERNADSASKITQPVNNFLTGIWEKRVTTVSKCKSIMFTGNFPKLANFQRYLILNAPVFILKLTNDLQSEESRIRNM
jgi:hypothetical protein